MVGEGGAQVWPPPWDLALWGVGGGGEGVAGGQLAGPLLGQTPHSSWRAGPRPPGVLRNLPGPGTEPPLKSQRCPMPASSTPSSLSLSVFISLLRTEPGAQPARPALRAPGPRP